MPDNQDLLKSVSHDVQGQFILALLKEAKNASHKRKPHEAIFFYDEIIKLDPENEEAWWGKGGQYQYLRYQEETLEFLEEEVKCYEKILICGEEAYYFVWFYKAEAHEKLGQIGEAILCYERFIELCDEEDQEDLEDGARAQIIKLSEKLIVC